jgi:hypothetical protein
VLEQAWTERMPLATPDTGEATGQAAGQGDATAEACGPDGCAG